MKTSRIGMLALSLLLGGAIATGQGTQPPSLLDTLPAVANAGYAAALAAARAKGERGRADVLFLELFYGDPAAHASAETALGENPAATAPDAAEYAFVQFCAAYAQGQDRASLQAALQLTQLAPNDPATELAVRALSGQLENQGRALLDAVPVLEHALEQPLSDPATAYMLGRSLLAAVHAPGLELSGDRALSLAGRVRHWQVWGPFGEFQNLGFDQTLPIEQGAAASYPDGTATRRAQDFDNLAGNGVSFPLDWNSQGIEFATTYVHAAAPTRVVVRFFSEASAKLEINGTTVLINDRRSRYTSAAAAAAIELPAGWSRVVVKLAGEAGREFDLLLRPAAGGGLENATALPDGAKPAGAPRTLAAPPTLGGWAAARLGAHPQDAVALWVDGIRRQQDDDAEHAVTELQQAAKLAPNAAPIWLELANAYTNLTDASQSWAAAQVEQAAQTALRVSPHALRADDRLGHVYGSEGKPTEAAKAYAACAGKGYADCDWSAFRLAASQHWLPETEAALDHALAESGSDWASIAGGLDFYASIGNAAKTTAWSKILDEDPRASAALGAYDLRHGQAAAAVKALRTAIAYDPSAPELQRELLQALVLSGDLAAAQPAAKAALAAFPDNRQIASEADEVALQGSLSAGIAQLRSTDYNRDSLRHEADFLAGDKFWAPWYHSATEVIQDAPSAAQYPTASSVLVLDQMVDRINPDSSQDQYIHQVYRVLNAAGISNLGDVGPCQTTTACYAPGGDMITLRTIKQDGSVLLPEKAATGGNTITMPGLEAGDYIEVEFVQHTAPSQVIPGELDNNEFFVFNSSLQPFHYSDYIVLSPPNYPLLVDQERFPGEPTVKTLPDGYTSREWLVQKTRILITEPHMPLEQNLVPKVWVSSQLDWNAISNYYADHLYAVQRADPAMQQQAMELAAGKHAPVEIADAIFNWTVANIQPADGNPFVPARQYFADRSGSRLAVFLGLLSAAHVPWQAVWTRPVTDDSSTKIPSIFEYQFPLIHVEGAAADAPPGTGWYDLNADFAKLDYIASALRGSEGLVAGAQGNALYTKVPAYDSPLDSVNVAVKGTVADNGDATVHVEVSFNGPNGEQVRQALADQPDSRLPQIYQQMLLGNYPQGIATGGAIENRAQKGAPLIISIDGTVPGFVHLDGANAGAAWDIEHLAGAIGLLSRYAPLQTREHPLVIEGNSSEETKVTLTLPAKFGAAALPAAASLKNQFGSFTSNFAQSGTTLSFDRVMALNAALVPTGDYGKFRDFAEGVDNQDRLRVTGTLQP